MKRLIYSILLSLSVLTLFCTDLDLKEPGEPALPLPGKEENRNLNRKDYNIEYKRQNGFFYQGYYSQLNQLSFEQLEYNSSQKITLQNIHSLSIDGYTLYKKTFDQEPLAIVFYIPYQFTIQLKDGSELKAKGRIRQLESFYIQFLSKKNEIVKQKCYTYFIRYWLEDKAVFSDNQSADYNEIPVVKDDVITYIEFKPQTN